MKRAVIYLRVSSTQQADTDYDPEGFSIPAQREACQRKAEALEAIVVNEYIDRGESAKTAKRPALQEMLARLRATRDIDYVIVHKIDRLARNRADDVEIVMQIRSADAQVVSVTENIDETPSGLLLHGIMSSIAEFYSRNLATEIMKGSTQKAKNGGTLSRAPLGYLNVRDFVDGREIRTVALDPERAPLIKTAFELYGTGNYTLRELSQFLEERGLRSRGTRKAPSKPLGPNRIQSVLRNDYYIGVVRYCGKVYSGRHEPLISVSAFERVQTVLDTRRVSGERDRIHQHYLKGTLYCDECGGRLIFSRNRGRRRNTYDYFVCRGKQIGTCSQPYHRVDRLEAAVLRTYATLDLSEAQVERIRGAIHNRVDTLSTFAEQEVVRAKQQLSRLLDEERKLLHQHYDNLVSNALFREEQTRLRRERAAAEEAVEKLSADYDLLRDNLDRALRLAGNVSGAYAIAGRSVRRLLNQAFFEQLRIREDDVVEAVLAEPFRQLLADDLIQQLESTEKFWQDTMAAFADPRRARPLKTPEKDRTPNLSAVGGSISERMVELAGLEPATSWVRSRRSPN
jgi:site-specific DNA recombinase